MNIRLRKFVIVVLMFFICFQASGGEHTCECTIEDIEKEVSYLAKKLLELAGTEEYTIEKPPTSKAIIGACFEVTKSGINLTCITPGLSPQEEGLITGDVIVEINEINFVRENMESSQSALDKLVKNIKNGDILRMGYKVGSSVKYVDIEVRQLTSPGFTFKVTNSSK